MARSSKKVKPKAPVQGWLSRIQGWPLVTAVVVGIVAVFVAFSDSFQLHRLSSNLDGSAKRGGGSKGVKSAKSTSASSTSYSSPSVVDQQSPSATALAALLDASLLTPLARRTPVPLAAVDVLLAADWSSPATSHVVSSSGGESGSGSDVSSDKQSLGLNAVLNLDASPQSNGAGPTSTGGGLTPLGYALLLHDTALLHHLLNKHRASPTVAVAAPPPDPSKAETARTSPPGIVLGASHESALGDGLKPLHLALLQKDVVTDASRRYLAANAVNAFAAAPDASGHKSDSSFPSSSSVSRNPSSSDQVDASSPIAAVLRRLTEAASSSEATSKCSSSQRAISATAVQGAVHREVTAPMLDSLFQAMWQQQKGEKQVEHSSSGARVVVAALQSRDKWGRTPLHLAVQTGNQGAVSLLLHHWQSAMDIVVGTVSTLAGSATPDDNNIDAASASIHDEIPNSIPEASSSSSSSKFPPGFGCWPFGAVDQLNRNVFHYAASRGDIRLLQVLRAFDPSNVHKTQSKKYNDDNDEVEGASLNREFEGAKIGTNSIDHPCGAFFEARDVNGWAPNDYLLLTASTEMVSSGENGSITAQSSKNGNNSSSTGDRAEADTDGALQEEMEEKVEKSSEAWHSNGGWPQESLPYSRGSNYEKCDIDVVKGATLTARDFLIRYLAVSRPVLIQGAADNWPFRKPGHAQRWTKSSFMERFGDHPVQPSSIPYAPTFGLSAETTSSLGDYISGLVGDHERNKPLTAVAATPSENEDVSYVFSDRPHVGMLHDFALSPPWLKVAPHLVDPMPAAVQFYVGPKGSGAPVHWHGDAWNALAFGKKAWALWPPARAAFSNIHDSRTHTSDNSFLEPDEDKRSGGSSSSHGSPESDCTNSSSSSVGGVGEALRCEQRAGDVMFVPSGWGHAILNLQASVGVAVEFRYAASFFA